MTATVAPPAPAELYGFLVARIDRALSELGPRALVAGDEITDLLLDLRLAALAMRSV